MRGLETEFNALARQGRRWLFAGLQDRNVVVRYLHLTYAARDLEHAVGLSCKYGLPRVVDGADLYGLLESARAAQDKVQRYLVQVVPNRPRGLE